MRLLKTIISIALCTYLSHTFAADTDSRRLRIIKERGMLIVGVKTDYPPWSYYDSQGNIVGIEPDLAHDIADRLGVQLHLSPVNSSNRIDRLESGAIDLLIATMGDTEKRRAQTGIIEPSYYSSGASIIVHKDNHLESWAGLYGRSICLTRNAYFNRDIVERFLLKPQEYVGVAENLTALKSGQCSGWIYDDTAIAKLLGEPRWQDFKAPLNTIMVNPWAIAVQDTEQHSAFGLLVSDAIIDWHRTGQLLALEKKWGVRNSQFLIDQNNRWVKKNTDGQFLCERLANNQFAVACLSPRSIGASNANNDQFLAQWGIDFPPAYDNYSQQVLLKGIGLTLLLSLLAIVGSLLFGLMMGVLLFRLPSVWRWPLSAVNALFSMTPPLLNLYIIFFGIGSLAALHYGIQFNGIVVAVIVFSLYAGSSNGALFYRALKEDAQAHPEHDVKTQFASAFQHAYEGINANAINIVKAVGIASTIAVPELISASNNIIAEFGSKTEMMTFLLCFYFLMVYGFIFLLNQLKQSLSTYLIKRDAGSAS